jgi:hypothetical protein
MEKLLSSHRELKQAIRETTGFARQTPKLIETAREKLRSAQRRLLDDYLDPLGVSFRAGDEQAVDEVVDFLAIDIPAFRCGYYKEKWLRRLKSVPLTERQQQKLKRAALSLCASPPFRREIVEWNRLMIKLADRETVIALFGLMESDNPFVKDKARRMLHGILQNRTDIIQPDYLRRALLFHLLNQTRQHSDTRVATETQRHRGNEKGGC